MAAGGQRLALLHLHQRSAALDARERLAAAALAAAPRSDLIAVATCHRVELYAAPPRDADPYAWFAGRIGADVPREAVLTDGDVARHVFRVACGLDSAVRGEGQILGQIRRTFDAARASSRLDPLLADLFQHALHVARVLRATTPLGTVRRSVGSLAVDEGVRLLPDASSATALVIGAGEIGKLAARALRHRVGHLVIANRDRARARALALDIGAEAAPLDAIDGALSRADLVISAADTRGQLLAAERLAARLTRGPLVLVDIAVPRSVDAAGRALPGLVYRDVDDLSGEPEPHLGDALAAAEDRCAAEAEVFTTRAREREASAVIHALRDRAERLRRARLERALAKLGHLGARDRRVVETLAASLTNALLHEPTVALRRSPQKAEEAAAFFGLNGRSARSTDALDADGRGA